MKRYYKFKVIATIINKQLNCSETIYLYIVNNICIYADYIPLFLYKVIESLHEITKELDQAKSELVIQRANMEDVKNLNMDLLNKINELQSELKSRPDNVSYT